MGAKRPRPWHCGDCGVELPNDRGIPFCLACWTKRCERLPIPIRQMTPDQLKAYKKSKRPRCKVRIYERRYIRKHYGRQGDCITCGKALYSYAKRCRACWTRMLHAQAVKRGQDPARREARLAYYRAYMKQWRAKSPQERAEGERLRALNALRRRPVTVTLCATTLCELYGKQAHHHCDCGEPIRPDEHVCQTCISEQARVEHKVWPTEEEEAA